MRGPPAACRLCLSAFAVRSVLHAGRRGELSRLDPRPTVLRGGGHTGHQGTYVHIPPQSHILEVVNGCLRLSVSQVAVNSVKAECKQLRIDISAIALSQVRDDLHVSLSLFVIGSYSIPIPSGANETRVPAHAYVC